MCKYQDDFWYYDKNRDAHKSKKIDLREDIETDTAQEEDDGKEEIKPNYEPIGRYGF